MSAAHSTQKEIIEDEEVMLRKLFFELQAGETIVFEKAMVIYSSNDVDDPHAAGKQSLLEALEKGYKRLKEEHQPYWDRIWDKIDIRIDEDLLSQVESFKVIYTFLH